MSRRPALEAVVVAAVTTAMTALLAWPVPIRPATWQVGTSYNDHQSLAWTFDFVARRLAAGQAPWGRTDRIEFPDGATLFPADVLEATALAPLVLAFGAWPIVNALLIAHHGLAAGAAWGWLRAEGAGATGAATGALIVAFHAALTTATFNGNPDVTPFWFAPAALWAIASPGRGRAALAGALCVLGGLASPYVGVIATGAVAARAIALRRWAELAIALSIALAGGLGFVALQSAALRAPDAAILKGPRADAMGTAALLDLLWPPPYVLPTDTRWDVPRVAMGAYLGVAALLAAARSPRPRAFGVGLLALGVIAALGPSLRPFTLRAGPPPIAEHGLVPLPWALAAMVPGLGQLTLTARFTGWCALGLAWLAARAAPAWGRAAPWLAALVAVDLLVFAEGGRMLRAAPIWDDGAAAALADLEPGAVLDLPPTFHELWLASSLAHGRSVGEGINRPVPPQARRVLERGDPDTGAHLRALGFRWLVVHHTLPHPAWPEAVSRLATCAAVRTPAYTIVDLDCAAR